MPATTSFFNGAFGAGIALLVLYVLIWLARGSWRSLFPLGTGSRRAGVATLLILWFGCAAQAAGEQVGWAGFLRMLSDTKSEKTETPPVIIPYEGRPDAAEESDKILIPYARFVELWNQAHPDDPIDQPHADTRISLSDV
ncbi:MAG: hypothetical protein ACYS14_15075, partial [Planctomycetota bacterium]